MPDPTPTVLCVDDCPDVQNLVGRFLAADGVRVVRAVTGEEALHLASREKPDLVLLDVLLPDVNGYEVCVRLGELPDQVSLPIIFLTSQERSHDRAHAFRLGAADFLTKPVKREALFDSVFRHLKTRDRWRRLTEHGTSHSSEGAGTDYAKFLEFLARDLDRGVESLDGIQPRDIYARCVGAGVPAATTARAMAQFLSLKGRDALALSHPEPGILPAAFCRANSVVPFRNHEGQLSFALSNPFDLFVRDALESVGDFEEKPEIVVCEPSVIADMLLPDLRRPLADRRRWEDVPRDGDLLLPPGESSEEYEYRFEPDSECTPQSDAIAIGEDFGDAADDAPIIRFVDQLIDRAIESRASDVHVEPRSNGMVVRMRIDGVLREESIEPSSLHPPVASRLKILGNMDIAKRRIPQDGRLHYRRGADEINIRISSLPSLYGEKIVLRVLDEKAVSLDLATLGFEGQALERVQAAIRRPYGMVLATGPTGSGKSTTLYAALESLNRPGTNILTVEDPVEYELYRVTQVQVHREAGMTFPAALRSILRQDPDVIMVGEIRDAETLDIALKAAMTGHLVFSTLHTNDAPATIARLCQMAEPYMVAAALEAVIAQRLMRRLCEKCKRPTIPSSSAIHTLGIEEDSDLNVHEAVGCEACGGTGYHGRVLATEVMPIDAELRELIGSRADAPVLRKHAVTVSQMTPFRRDAIEKALRGITSLDEVARVTG